MEVDEEKQEGPTVNDPFAKVTYPIALHSLLLEFQDLIGEPQNLTPHTDLLTTPLP